MGKAQTKAIQKNSKEPELVLTPGGWRPKSMVHLIEPGHHVRVLDGNLMKVNTLSGSVVTDFGKVEKKANRLAVYKPFKKIKGKSTGQPAPAPQTNQWIVNSGWLNSSGNPITYFSTSWVVPPAPATSSGQTIYLFNGIQQTPSGPYILQPVLQWGASPAGGDSNWYITNWYVNGQAGIALHGTLVKVNIGDTIQGIMTLTKQSVSPSGKQQFSYLSSFNGYPQADLPIENIEELKWANETLECYGLTVFSDYPDTIFTAMKDIEMKVGNTEAIINWDSENRVTDNGQKCVIVSDISPGGEVDLYYKRPVINEIPILEESIQTNLILLLILSHGGEWPDWGDPAGQAIAGMVIQKLANGLTDEKAKAEIQKIVAKTIETAVKKLAEITSKKT